MSQFKFLQSSYPGLALKRMLAVALCGWAVSAASPSVAAGQALAKRADKIAVCHHDTSSGTYSPISVVVQALPGHLRHGDFVADPTLRGETVYAIAYTNVDGLSGYSICDQFIIAFIEKSGDGIFGVGDMIMMGKYPTSFDPPYNFAIYRDPLHTINYDAEIDPLFARAAGQFNWNYFIWKNGSTWAGEFVGSEGYGQSGVDTRADYFVHDWISGQPGWHDTIFVDDSVSDSSVRVYINRVDPIVDDPFVDVAVFPSGMVLVP